MIRHCNGSDPNLVTRSGDRGNCGRSFDDVTHLVICPHEPFDKTLSRELLSMLAEPTHVLDSMAVLRYRFYTDERGVIIHCEPCQGIPHRVAPTPHWGVVRGLPDAIAWFRYHELTTPHPLREAPEEIVHRAGPTSPGPDYPDRVEKSLGVIDRACPSIHAAKGRCCGFLGHLPRTHANLNGEEWSDEDAAMAAFRAYAQVRAGNPPTYVDAIAQAFQVSPERVREVLAEVDPHDTLARDFPPPPEPECGVRSGQDGVYCTLPMDHGDGSKIHQCWRNGTLWSEWRSVLPEDEDDRETVSALDPDAMLTAAGGGPFMHVPHHRDTTEGGPEWVDPEATAVMPAVGRTGTWFDPAAEVRGGVDGD